MRIHPLRRLSRFTLYVLHWLAHLSHGLLVLAIVVLAGAAWRLAQGPVDVSWLTARLEAGLNTPDSPFRLHIGHTALAWEGFRLGVDRPIDLRLTDVRLTDAARHQTLSVPQAELSLSFAALLAGRIRPRAIELDRPRLAFRRARDGTVVVDFGDLSTPGDQQAGDQQAGNLKAGNQQPGNQQAGDRLPALLTELARPPATDRGAARGWFSQIRRVRIRDAAVTIQDQQLEATWQAPRADIDLVRDPHGGVSGTADLDLALGNQHARLQLTGDLAAAATQTEVTAQLSPVVPAALAGLSPHLAPLAALDAPVALDATLRLGPGLALEHARITLQAGSGTLRFGDAAEPIVSAELSASGTLDALQVDSAEVDLRGHPDGPLSALRATGSMQRQAGSIAATLSLALDQVDFADLAALWPQGVADSAREWVLENITAGVARDGQVQLGLQAKDDLSDITVSHASGTLDGSGLTVHWLRPVPPIENGQGQLRILDADTLDIAVTGGQQMVSGSHGRLTIKSGTMRITGLLEPHQASTLQIAAAGSLPDALALLRDKRLRLLSAHPIRLDDPAGQVSATLSVRLPLEKNVVMDDIAIHATVQLDRVHLTGVVAGQPLDQGKLELTATNDGMTLKGSGQLAGIATQFDGAMDFRAGGPNQVVQRLSASGRPDVRQLAAAGLDATDLLSGPVPLQADLTQQRNGAAALAVHADLTPAVLTLEPLAWSKPAGQQALASATLRLARDRLTGIQNVSVTGTGIAVQGSVECTDGHVSLIRLNHAVIGRNDLSATVRLPQTRASPIVVDVSGRALDLSGRLARKHQPTPPNAGEPPPGPPWTLGAHFERVRMANNTLLERVNVQAANDGSMFRRLHLTGDTRDRGPVDLRITPEAAGRRLAISAAQAGDLLRALDWSNDVQGGRLAVTGSYDDSKPNHPLTASAELTDFRVREAVGLGKLLQAMTLYGLVDAMRGPGLSFNKAIIPFRLTSQNLEITGARAFSSSLGLTAKGHIDLNAERVDMQGTIVPAYFFNSLLGHVPLLGKLLSPEQGGGVFAARYTLRGKLADPDVSVNPLSALTPGFLRGLFDGF